MYDCFRDAIHQIFQNNEFTECCYINGFETTCICSPIGDNILYTDAGLANGVNFCLDLQIATLHQLPNEGDKVIFRDKTYKIGSTEMDSAAASMKIYLIALSKGS